MLLYNVTVMGTTVCKRWLQTTSGKNSQIAKWQINGRLICRHHWFVNTLGQGRIQGEGGGGTRRPPEIGKNMIFWRKIVIFHTKYPNNFRASHRSAQFFLSAPPPSLKSWIRPWWPTWKVNIQLLSNWKWVISESRKDSMVISYWTKQQRRNKP